MNWPNLISLGRLLSTPLIIWFLLTDRMATAFISFFVAGFSDILDGFLARVLKIETAEGVFLDGLADKVLLMGIFFALGVKHLIPLWLVILVIFRDVLIMLGVIVFYILLSKTIVLRPVSSSKVNTLMQILLVLLAVGQEGFHLFYPVVDFILVILTAIATVISGIQYVMLGIKRLKENGYF